MSRSGAAAMIQTSTDNLFKFGLEYLQALKKANLHENFPSQEEHLNRMQAAMEHCLRVVFRDVQHYFRAPMEEKFHGTKDLSIITNTELKEVESHEEEPEDFEESDVLLLVG
jgi:hypothetical protein